MEAVALLSQVWLASWVKGTELPNPLPFAKQKSLQIGQMFLLMVQIEARVSQWGTCQMEEQERKSPIGALRAKTHLMIFLHILHWFMAIVFIGWIV